MDEQGAERPRVDLYLSGAREVITCVPRPDDPVGRRRNTDIAIVGEQILAVGVRSELASALDLSQAGVLDVQDKIIAPGFVDSHTHLVFGGSRVKEYAARMTMSAEEVQSSGIPVGIQATVQMTRGASLEQLVSDGLDRLWRMFRHGTTTVESKTGYGLSLEQEMKLLEANRRLQQASPVDVVSTFLGAHDFPTEIPPERYVDIIVEEMIPRVAEAGLAEFTDVYCDQGYYTVEQSRRILEAGKSAGLKAKIHVDAYADIGGAAMSADLGVVSADHLNYTPRSAMRQLAIAGVIGVVMPALDFAVGHQRPFNARAMMEEGMTLALATDFCPACWVESMQLVMAMACRLYGLSPEQALLGATLNGARALDRAHDRGSIEPGKLADLQIWDIPALEDVIYRIGNNAVSAVIKRGRLFSFSDPSLVRPAPAP